MLVGVDKYTDPRYESMESITNDLNEMETFVQKHFEYDQLTTFRGHRTLKDNLEAGVKNFFVNCDETDTLILYWSGHGDRIYEEGYLVCSDSRADDVIDDKISMKELANTINNTKAKAVVVIVDCCYSGHLAKSRKEHGELQIHGKGKVTISASSDEKAFSEGSNGVFTRFLLNELYDLVHLEGYQKIDITDLYSRIVVSMENANKKQVPNLKATIQGRLYLSFNNLKMSLPGISRGKNNANKKKHEILETLNLALKARDGLDTNHDFKMISPYLNTELPVGKLKRLIINPLDEQRYFISLDLYDWVTQSRIESPTNLLLLPITSRPQAEEIHEAAKRNEVYIIGTIENNRNYLFFSKLVLKYRETEIELEGIKSRRPIMELKFNNRIEWFSYSKDSINFIILTLSENNTYSLFSQPLNNDQPVINYEFSIKNDEEILEGVYYKNSDICVFKTINSDWVYSVYVYSIKDNVTYVVPNIKKKQVIIPINIDYYFILGDKSINLFSFKDNESLSLYKFRRGIFSSYPLFNDFVSASKIYLSFENQLYSAEIREKSLEVEKIKAPSEVLFVISEKLLLQKAYDGSKIYNIDTGDTQLVSVNTDSSRQENTHYFQPGIIVNLPEKYNNYEKSSSIRCNYISSPMDSYGESLFAESISHLLSISHSGKAIACKTEKNSIVIWK